MNPSRPYILRPVATSLLMAAILIVGAIGYLFLPLSALPEVDYPTIQVQTFLPGASPEVMTSTVTAPLERQFGADAGPQGDVVAQLRGGFGHHAAVRSEPQHRHRRAGSAGGHQRRRQPAAAARLPAPPIYAKVNPADAPILTLAVTSTSMPITQVEDLSDTRIAQKISQLAGVGLVSINGAQRPAVRIQINLQALAAYGLNIDDLRTTISNANSDAPKGSFDGAARAYSIDANDQIASAQQYAGHHRRLQRRHQRARAAVRRGHGHAERREQQTVELDERNARHTAQRAAPAGRQCHRRGRPDPQAPAEHPQLAAGQRRADRAHATAPIPSAPRSATCSSS